MIDRLNAALEGRYRIERQLGEGGMATVFLANDLKHDRKVALKVLKPELAAVVGAERFLAEIKTTANLQHPHILPLFDSGEADSFLFYVMPYVAGESLREKLDREKQLSVDDAVALTKKIASALHYAHEQGVVHRDIKPANILMSRGDPLVADFGIALALSEAGGGRITETGLSLGTPHYMSPEQASGDQSLDKRSDVYALGCILYELLTGEPPHGGPTAQSVLAKILTGDATRVTELRRTVPAHVDAAVAKALEKLPADRFVSAEAFVRALDDPAFRHGGAGGDGGTTAAAERRAQRSHWVLVTGIAVAAIAGAVAGYALRSPEPERVFRAAIDMPEDQALFDLPFGNALALTPDGSKLIYAGPGEERRWRFWVRQADALEATPIRGSEDASSPVVSPSGEAVAFTNNSTGQVSIVNLAGGTADRPGVNAYLIADWTESGHIYYVDSNGTDWFRIPDDGGDPEPVPGPSLPVEWGIPGIPPWAWADILPGEEKGVFTRIASNGAATEVSLVVMDLETGEYETLTTGSYPRYLPSGYLTWVTTAGDLRAAPFGNGQFTGPAVTLAQGIRVDVSGTPSVAISEHGDLVYRAGAGGGGLMQVMSAEVTGADGPVDPEWNLVPAGAGNWSGLDLSPDGTRLVVTNGTDAGSQLWVKDLTDDSPPSRITFEGDFHVRPRWTPAGDSVVFISSLGGATEPTQVWITAADGSGSPRRVAAAEVEIEEALISPDGEWLVYRQGGTTANRDIYAKRLNVDSAGRPLIATDDDEKSPQLSPDGRWLAYVSDLTGTTEVYVQPFPDVSEGRWQVSVGGGVSPTWSPDGNALYYVARDGMLTRARLRTTDAALAITSREPLFQMNQEYVDLNYPALEVTPDGERFLYFSFGTRQDATVVWIRNGLAEALGL